MSECKECGGLLGEFPLGNCTNPHIETTTDKSPRRFPFNEFPDKTSVWECYLEEYGKLQTELVESHAKINTLLEMRDILIKQSREYKARLERAESLLSRITDYGYSAIKDEIFEYFAEVEK